MPKKWNYETDVIVVGFGGAGAVAAITAKDAGVDVLILEKQPKGKHTPSTKMSGGSCQIANNAHEAAKYFRTVAFGLGIPDQYGDPSKAYPNYPTQHLEEIVKIWSEGIVQTEKFLKSLGKIEIEKTIPCASFREFSGMQSCGLIKFKGNGVALFSLLSNAVNRRQIDIKWSTAGKKLIIDKNGAVIGVSAKQGNIEINYKARKAVVLANGGFEFNEELKKAFLPGWGWAFIGNPGNTGDGLKMAMGAGAGLSHMHHCAARVVAGGRIMEEAGTAFNCKVCGSGKILVDNYGKRYSNEEFTSKDPERYHFYKNVLLYNATKLEYPRIPSWFIFDEEVRKKEPVILTWYGANAVGLYNWSADNSDEIKMGWILKGMSIAELAEIIAEHPDNKDRMFSSVLKNTIKRFNKFSEKGHDLDFNRSKETLGSLKTAPYYAIAMYPGGPNTEGGPVKNAQSQVLNTEGQVIPRLYAAGEIASTWSFLYQIGGNIAECIISGRVAGKNAAAEKSCN